MRRSCFLLLALLPLCACPAAPGSAAAPAADSDAVRISEAYRAARPGEDDLGIFRLDWADSLPDARARAQREGRPVFFVSTTQLKDAGDLRGGHC